MIQFLTNRNGSVRRAGQRARDVVQTCLPMNRMYFTQTRTREIKKKTRDDKGSNFFMYKKYVCGSEHDKHKHNSVTRQSRPEAPGHLGREVERISFALPSPTYPPTNFYLRSRVLDLIQASWREALMA
ncbi:hypothetical protein EVAR_41182_1 [Eumeta japonica]|uniref:Uncharacterized protein n=1 Tax=Eumeta variegata TaxID=151549 RepID=A0A4C1WPC6_EUMVA|nr:hypothetical protein EVAR_41182_1 [Eumeta japonica]